MRSHIKSVGLCALSVCCLGIIALAGCGNKDAPKPAHGEYYSGEMDKKPTGASPGGGKFKVGAPPAAPQ